MARFTELSAIGQIGIESLMCHLSPFYFAEMMKLMNGGTQSSDSGMWEFLWSSMECEDADRYAYERRFFGFFVGEKDCLKNSFFFYLSFHFC